MSVARGVGPVRELHRIFITESQVPTIRIFLVFTIDAGSVLRSGPEPGVLLAAASTIEEGNGAQNVTSTGRVFACSPEIWRTWSESL